MSSRFIGGKSAEIDLLIDQGLEEIVSFTEADAGYVFRFFEDGEVFSMSHLWRTERLETAKENLQNLGATAMPWWMDQLKAGKVVAVLAVEELPEAASVEKEILQSQGIGAIVDVPMRYEGKVVGFLGLLSQDEFGPRMRLVYCNWSGRFLPMRCNGNTLRQNYRLRKKRQSARHVKPTPPTMPKACFWPTCPMKFARR